MDVDCFRGFPRKPAFLLFFVAACMGGAGHGCMTASPTRRAIREVPRTPFRILQRLLPSILHFLGSLGHVGGVGVACGYAGWHSGVFHPLCLKKLPNWKPTPRYGLGAHHIQHRVESTFLDCSVWVSGSTPARAYVSLDTTSRVHLCSRHHSENEVRTNMHPFVIVFPVG